MNCLYDCKTCKTKCSDKSNLKYIFDNDLEFAEISEKCIKQFLENEKGYKVIKTEPGGPPDLFVVAPEKHFYVEVKVQTRAFMQIALKCPESGLTPSETVVIDKSDLLHYQYYGDVYLTFILYRPCFQGLKIFTQHINKLKAVYEKQGNKNEYTRRVGEGDGNLGVRTKYHLSLKDFKETHVPEKYLTPIHSYINKGEYTC